MKENKIKTPGIIGIDAGGTYTDLAFISSEDWSVQARVKTPTNHDDMVKTIEEGLDLILRILMPLQFALLTLRRPWQPMPL